MHFRFQIDLIILNMPISNGKVPKNNTKLEVHSFPKRGDEGPEYHLGESCFTCSISEVLIQRANDFEIDQAPMTKFTSPPPPLTNTRHAGYAWQVSPFQTTTATTV